MSGFSVHFFRIKKWKHYWHHTQWLCISNFAILQGASVIASVDHNAIQPQQLFSSRKWQTSSDALSLLLLASPASLARAPKLSHDAASPVTHFWWRATFSCGPSLINLPTAKHSSEGIRRRTALSENWMAWMQLCVELTGAHCDAAAHVEITRGR